MFIVLEKINPQKVNIKKLNPLKIDFRVEYGSNTLKIFLMVQCIICNW